MPDWLPVTLVTGWTMGNIGSNGGDLAQFFFDLFEGELQPAHYPNGTAIDLTDACTFERTGFLTQESIELMTAFKPPTKNRGWMKSADVSYGLGLMNYPDGPADGLWQHGGADWSSGSLPVCGYYHKGGSRSRIDGDRDEGDDTSYSECIFFTSNPANSSLNCERANLNSGKWLVEDETTFPHFVGKFSFPPFCSTSNELASLRIAYAYSTALGEAPPKWTLNETTGKPLINATYDPYADTSRFPDTSTQLHDHHLERRYPMGDRHWADLPSGEASGCGWTNKVPPQLLTSLYTRAYKRYGLRYDPAIRPPPSRADTCAQDLKPRPSRQEACQGKHTRGRHAWSLATLIGGIAAAAIAAAAMAVLAKQRRAAQATAAKYAGADPLDAGSSGWTEEPLLKQEQGGGRGKPEP